MAEHVPNQNHEQDKIEQLRRAMYSRSISPHIKDKERRRMHESEPLVGPDWARPEPGVVPILVAPQTLSISRAVIRWALAAAVVFFLGAAVFFVYYFIFGGGALPASPANINISIAGPLNVSGGEPAGLQIAVTNRNQVSLELADLVITYPSGTRSPTNLSVDLPSQRIPLGSIEPGGRRQGTVSAIFSGREGDRGLIQVELEYRLQGSSAIFVASADYQISFTSSPLSLSIEGNSETISGQSTALTITITSNAAASIRDAVLSVGYPFGFTFSSATPQPARPGLWELGTFLPGEKKTVVLRGALSGESGDERIFRFSVGTRTSSDRTTIDTVLDEETHRMFVSRPFLSLALSVNGSSGNNVVVSPGDNVAILVSYTNNLPVSIADAVVVARLSGLPIDGETVQSLDGFYRSADNAVLWDKNTTGGALGSIVSGARGSVGFTFRVPDSEALSRIEEPRLTLTVSASGKRLSETGVPENLQASTMQSIRVASDLSVTVQGLYYSSPFGSTGPMPPTVEKETTYAIVFTITNTTSRVTGAAITATLPSYVRWVGVYSPSSEQITFNARDGIITWNVGDIASHVGVGGTLPRQAAIAIGFTPSTSQVGQQPVLLQNITLRGVDVATGATVSRAASEITTNISGDPGFSPVNATVVK